MPMSYHETISILDTWEPDTLPSQRYNRIVSVGKGHVLELRDPNSGQGGGPKDMPRHQYARAGGHLWTRRLPPETVGDEWIDGSARWERVMPRHIQMPHPILEWSREGHEFPLVVMRRQRFYSAEDDVEYMIRGEYVDVDSEGLEWPCGPCIASWWDVPLPPCPDCGGDVVWWEAGYVPGTRRCVGKPIRKSGGQPAYNPDGGCGSMFAVDVRRRSLSDRQKGTRHEH